jgi:hypothetical protein
MGDLVVDDLGDLPVVSEDLGMSGDWAEEPIVGVLFMAVVTVVADA